jgi:hypothetical protein
MLFLEVAKSVRHATQLLIQVLSTALDFSHQNIIEISYTKYTKIYITSMIHLNQF